MFGLSHLQAQLVASGVGVAVLIGLVVWLRADAADDRERELRANQNTSRLQHIEKSKGTQSEIENLSDSNLDHALCRVLSTTGECDRRRALQGREPPAAESAVENN